jgi:hypothetical protein
MLGNSSVSERILASQEGLSSMELVKFIVPDRDLGDGIAQWV